MRLATWTEILWKTILGPTAQSIRRLREESPSTTTVSGKRSQQVAILCSMITVAGELPPKMSLLYFSWHHFLPKFCSRNFSFQKQNLMSSFRQSFYCYNFHESNIQRRKRHFSILDITLNLLLLIPQVFWPCRSEDNMIQEANSECLNSPGEGHMHHPLCSCLQVPAAHET